MSSISSVSNFISELLPQINDWKSATIWDSFKTDPNSASAFIQNLMNTKSALDVALLRFNGAVSGKAAEQDLDYNKYFEYPNTRLFKLAAEITKGSYDDTEKMYKVEQWVNENITYQTDDLNYGQNEYWAYPTETLLHKDGDCIANYEEIWTKDGLKEVGALQVGDIVLSYDFDKKSYCYKPVLKIWEKGNLPIFRVKFTNGTWIDVTEDHPFWTRRVQKYSDYEKTKLCDIDLSRWWKRKIPCVKKLPYVIKDIAWLTEDLCFVIGHFLAEGDTDRSHVRTSGYDVPTSIVPILDKYNIPYSITTNNSGVPYLNFLSSKLKQYLRLCKVNSFDINIPEELFYLPANKLYAIINGHFLGDGHYSKYAENSNKEKTYSTSSYKLAYDLQRLQMQLGIPIHMWLQKDHKGLGNKPIWRLSYNSNSYFAKDYGYDGISEVSIHSVKPMGSTNTRDFMVADTHTFVSKFGHICHNCEDMAFLITSLALHAGVDPSRLRMYGGLVKAGTGAMSRSSVAGHGWGAFKRDDGEWVPIEGSYYATDLAIDERVPLKDNYNYVEDFWYVTKNGVVDATWRNYIRNPDLGARMTAEHYKGWAINIRV
jgi:hypothetical protein